MDILNTMANPMAQAAGTAMIPLAESAVSQFVPAPLASMSDAQADMILKAPQEKPSNGMKLLAFAGAALVGYIAVGMFSKSGKSENTSFQKRNFVKS